MITSFPILGKGKLKHEKFLLFEDAPPTPLPSPHLHALPPSIQSQPKKERPPHDESDFPLTHKAKSLILRFPKKDFLSQIAGLTWR